MNAVDRVLAHAVFPVIAAKRMRPIRIWHGRDPGAKRPEATAMPGTGGAALALGAGTARAAAAVTAVSAARCFRGDMWRSSVRDGRGCRLSLVRTARRRWARPRR